MRKLDLSQHYLLLAVASVSLWSVAATAFKESLAQADPWQVVFLSSAVSAVVLGIGMILFKKALSLQDVKQGACLGLLNPFLYYLVLLHAYNGLPAQMAMVVNYLWPVVLVLLSAPVLKQRITAGSISGILISFAGVAFMALSGGGSLNVKVLPLALALLSTVIWAIYWLLNARARGAAEVLFSSFIWGTAYLGLAGAVSSQSFAVSMKALPWILYIGVFEMGLTYMMWSTALKNAPSAAAVGSLIFITPFLSLVLIYLVVGEPIAGSTAGGLLLVVAGIFVERFFRERKGSFDKN
ncbi:hypothetical protein CSA37_02530 [Candidatus Fermentibacteria bacterium]|nr:MAG: hypothetical protein CSA37_02530 [Candidatus Fermentibacteria bacterium]